MKYHGFSCHLVRKREGKVETDVRIIAKYHSNLVLIHSRQAYTEFGVVENRGERVITCWIACQAGDDFALVWRDERRDSELDGLNGAKGTVRIDGMVCGKRESTDDHPQRFWGVSVGDGLKQPLIFSNAIDSVTTDEMEARADEGRLSGLGSIEVIIQRGVVEDGAYTPVRHKKFSDATPSQVLRHGPVFLEADKYSQDISHTVRFGKPMATSNYGKFRMKDFAGGRHPDRVGWLEPNPYVTFIFKYRSRNFLKAQGHLIDDGTSTIRNTVKAHANCDWDKDSKAWTDNNIEVISIGSDDDDYYSDGMDVDSRYDRARSRTRFSTDPLSDPAAVEHEREMLRAKLEI